MKTFHSPKRPYAFQSARHREGSFLITLCALMLASSLAGCGHKDPEYDAYGVFEATEVIVSAEVSGRILSLETAEGTPLKAGSVIGYIDSTQLSLTRQQLEASLRGLRQRRPDVHTQLAALEAQVNTARREQQRLEKLVLAQAATQKQLDDLNGQLTVLERQLAATQSNLETTLYGLDAEETALQLKIEQVSDQLAKCRLSSPIDGTLVVKYAEPGELAVPGKPLFKVADLDHMFLRAYVTADQLAQVKLGQRVTVYADYGRKTIPYKGKVTWIASTAEFTPKTIQTKQERANLVYAVKVAVTNDGYLKIGLYGGLTF